MIKYLFFSSFFIQYLYGYVDKIQCVSDGNRDYVRLLNDDGIYYDLVDFDFFSTKFTDPFYTCSRWLDLSASDPRFEDVKKSISYIPLISGDKNQVARLTSESRTFFYNYCEKSNYCQVRFPYYLLEFDYLRSQLLGHKINPPAQCLEKAKLKNTLSLDTEIEFAKKVNLDLWSLPKMSFLSELEKQLDDQEILSISIYTMTISDQAISFLEKIAKDHQKIKIYVFFSFEIVSMDQESFRLILNNQFGNIFYFPVYRTPINKDSFHAKGIVIDYERKPSRLIFTSANFKNYSSQKLFDIGFTTIDQDLVSEFKSHVDELFNHLCSNQEFATCSFEMRLFDQHESNLMHQYVKKACKEATIFNDKNLRSISVFNSKKINVEQLILSHIKNAKKSIRLATHVFSSESIAYELLNASARGVEVEVLIGFEASDKVLSMLKGKVKYFLNTSKINEYHAKVILYDNQYLILGSGNFTPTGMSNPTEIFFALENQNLVNHYSDYFDSSKSEILLNY